MMKTAYRKAFIIGLLVHLINYASQGFGAYVVQVYPQPKEFYAQDKPCGLPVKVALTYVGPKSAKQEYTVNLITNHLGSRLNMKLVSPPQGPTNSEYLTLIDLQVSTEFTTIGPEGYTIGLDSDGRLHRLTIRASTIQGLLYGSLSLFDVMDESTRQANRLSVPDGLRIVDEPAMRTRLLPTMVQNMEGSAQARLDWLARCLFNGIWLTASASNENLSSIAQASEARAITLYGVVSFRGLTAQYRRVLCPLDANDRKIVTDLFERCAQAGCGGLVFLFDDLSELAVDHPKTCSECSTRMKGLADIQVAFLQLMTQVAETNGITKLIMCPTPYRTGWLEKYGLDETYFNRISSDSALQQVSMFHTDFYRGIVGDLQDNKGLKRYIWWNNGLWDTSKYYGIYVGVPRIGLSWNGYVEDTLRGPTVLSRAMMELHHLSELTEEVYPSPTGDLTAVALGGLYAWRPDAYCVNEEAYRRFVVEHVLGVKAYPPYRIWEEIMVAYATRAKNGLPTDTLLKSLALASMMVDQIKSFQETSEPLWQPVIADVLTHIIMTEMETSTHDALEELQKKGE